MAEVVLCVASTVAGCLMAPVDRLCGYVISYDSHVRELEAKVAELGNARQNVQDSINAQNNGNPIKDYVNKWVEDVDKHAEEARRALDDYRRANETCFYGWLPNLKVRYRLGREARRKAKDVQGLIDGKPSGEVYDNRPPGLVDGASDMISSAGDRGDTNFDSRASILEDIMNALGDEKHKVIGIYGEGGVGKTTLLKQVQKKLTNEKKLFHMIVKANVSQNPDFKKIQGDIAYALGLKTLNDETSEEGREEFLFKRLQNDPSEKVLIILDDLWKDLDLGAVGIPSKDESKGCKLLLTSRFKDVLEQMECHNSIFHLQGLKGDEAFRLFEKTVGNRLKDNEQLKTIVDQLVKKLAGLPLLINSVAKSLKDRDVAVWRSALQTIDPSHIETIVKWSYDHLKSKDTKTLFLLCGLIGGTIQVEMLLVLVMGLGFSEESRPTMQKSRMTMQESRDRLYTMLAGLRSACLLLDGDDDKENVTIHDLYSEAIVSTPFRCENSLMMEIMMNSNYGSWQKEKLEKCRAICLADVGKDRLTELIMTNRFLDLEILMLSQPNYWRRVHPRQHERTYCLESLDFESMKGLQVLYVRFIHFARLPSLMGVLRNLHTLYLDHCNVWDAAILGMLKSLQILCLAGSALSRLPNEIGNLTNLRLLNLRDCRQLRTIAPGVLKRLINLEELYLRGSFDQWMGKDGIPSESCNARLAELKSLTKITSLEISIPDPYVLLEDDDFPFGNLNRFWINIGNAKQQFKGELRTMILKLEEWDSILLKEWVQKLFQKTQYLHLEGLKEFKKNARKNAHELCTQGFGELKHLYIDSSPSIKYIANSSDGLPPTAFTILEHLFLKNLVDLEKICNGPVAQECFSILKIVDIIKCHRLKNLWFLSKMQRLVHLEVLKVCECDSMQVIISYGAGEVEVVSDGTVELPNLRILELRALPKMTSFCTGDEGAPIQVAFPRLETLEITGLDDLRFMFLPSMVKSLTQLRELRVSDCMNMEAIITEEEGWGMEASEILAFPMLTDLHLQRLKCVTCFFRTKYSQEARSEDDFNSRSIALFNQEVVFPNLEELHITDIGYIKMIWDNHVASSIPRHFQQLKTLDVSHCSELSNMFTPTMAGNLVKLTKLRISNCKNLTEIISNEGCKEGPIVAFKQLKYMELEELMGLTCFSSGRYTLLFPLLEDLIVTGCLNMKFFSEAPLRAPKLKRRQVSTEMWFWNENIRISMQNMSMDMATIDGVEFMHLLGSSRLTEKWHSKLIPIESSWQLKSLVVDSCPSFLNAIPSRLMLVLDKINTLQVQDCKQLEEIFDLEGLEAMESTRVLPQLWCLNLINLPKLRQLWNKDLQGMPFFNSLSYLTLYNCSNLRHAFTPLMARCLPTLQWMEIKKCGQMEGVIGEEEGNGIEVQKITFPILRGMELECLPNLTGFPSGEKYMLECPMLQELTIAHCPKITFNWQSLMKIGQGISSHFTPQVLFPPFKSMVLSHMDNSRMGQWKSTFMESGGFEKLRVEFCEIEEIDLPTIT